MGGKVPHRLIFAIIFTGRIYKHVRRLREIPYFVRVIKKTAYWNDIIVFMNSRGEPPPLAMT